MNKEIWILIAIAAGLFLLLLLTIYLSIRARRKQRLIDNIPTSKVAGVFVGLVEVKGTAEIEQPMVSFLAAVQCVYYSYSVDEHWSRTVTETYTDSEGKTKTRTRTETGWTTVASDARLMSFYLQDDTGLLLVHPSGAKIEASSVFGETCGRSDPLYYSKGPGHSVSNSTHRRRFSELAIRLHEPIYLMGRARERQEIVAAEVAADDRAPIFLISTRREEQISRSHGWAFWLWMILGLIVAAGAGFGVATAINSQDGIQIGISIAAACGYLFCWLIGWAWMVYNSTIDLKNRVDRAWSLIDIELKRRSDLIPRITSVVQGLAGYESKVHTELAALRSQAGATAPGLSGEDPRACKTTLLGIVESYPELNSNELFLKLHHQLVETEQRIALARGYFNDIATQHNTRMEIIPDRFFASMAGLKMRSLMEAADFERAVVKVDLSL